MEQGGRQQERITEFQLTRKDFRHRTGMTDVRGAGLAPLSLVEFVGKFQSVEKDPVFFFVFINILGHTGTIVSQVKTVRFGSSSCWKSVWQFTLCNLQSRNLLAHGSFSLSIRPR